MKLGSVQIQSFFRQLARPLWVALALALTCGTTRLMAAGEQTDFNNAYKLFENTFWSQAEANFANFAATYTNSTQLPAAVLYQARARLAQANYSGAIDLLQAQLPKAGKMADQYAYWIAESLMGQGNFQKAAESYAGLIKTYADSSLRLPASVCEAQAYAKLGDWPRVINLLQTPDSSFQSAAREQPRNDSAVTGLLLLAQALYVQQQYSEGERLVQSIPLDGLSQKLAWQRQYWLCRLELAGGRAAEALQVCTNSMWPLGMATGESQSVANSVALRGEILEKLGKLQEAIDIYTNNLAKNLSAEIHRQALFKTIELTLKQNQTQDAIKRLEAFIQQRPEDHAVDLARLTLGELALKSFFAPPETGTNAIAPTNYLQRAITNFDHVIQDFSDSPLRGKAYLDRGWCYWAQTNIPEAKTNFMEAVNRLSAPEDQVIARFKLADAQFSQRDYAAAMGNYTMILQQCEKIPSLKDSLFNKALYQILRASIELGDSAAATNAVEQIVNLYSLFNDDCLLLYGDFKTTTGKYNEARQIFTDVLKKFPNSSVLPEVQYAIARSYVQEGDWTNAVASFDRWINTYPQHRLLPQAEFSRALAYDKADMQTNALTLFTNYIAHYTNSLTPWAQNWVADYYFNQGEKYVTAEENYLKLISLPGAGDLAYQARLMAGRAAIARDGIQDARTYFSDLVKDLVRNTNSSPALLAQAYFALGDTIFRQFQDNPESSNSLAIFNEAISAFSRITNSPTDGLAPLAMGRIGDCNFEWAQHSDTNVYNTAAQCYQAVLNYPQAQVSETARSCAQVRLGLIAERQSKPREALDHYLKVLFATDPERFDSVWVKEAGEKAARICEGLEQWEQAIRIYNRVMTCIPSLRPALEKRIVAANNHLEAQKK